MLTSSSEDEITTTILYDYFSKFINELSDNLQYSIYAKNGDFLEFYCVKLNNFAECESINFTDPNALT